MTNLYVVDCGGGDDEHVRRASQRAENRRRLRTRYTRHLMAETGIDELTAGRVMVALFDARDLAGQMCGCACHPRLSTSHDDGFDCPCTWGEARRARRWREIWDGPAARELREMNQRENEAIRAWLAGQPGVEAARITLVAPEQWEGAVDGHSFYFRERHGRWQIELDLRDTGHIAHRLVGRGEDGQLLTETEPLKEGDVIAEGVESQLGATAIEHISFIVMTIRDHLWATNCDHAGSLF